MLNTIMNGLAKAGDWLYADSRIPIFVDKVTGEATVNNLESIFLIAVVIGVAAVCFNKKLRSKFF